MQITPQQAIDHGFTHEGKYYFIPIYLGDVNRRDENLPIKILTKNTWMNPLFAFVSWVEWLCTPPGRGALFLIGDRLDGKEEKEIA